jgi:aryl-phospho-beta-D-glucosidase BglC (GH1 family)
MLLRTAESLEVRSATLFVGMCSGIHTRTFYTRNDFVAIQKAGLNSLRIPIGYWAVDLANYEPYVSGQVSSCDRFVLQVADVNSIRT